MKKEQEEWSNTKIKSKAGTRMSVKTKVRIFTDGACSGNPGPGGWGYVMLLPHGNIKSNGYDVDTTNNRMELTAVIMAIEEARNLGHKDVEIHSDSSYVVNCITNRWMDKWKAERWRTSSGGKVKNKDLWEKLNELISDKSMNITFHKVKGHVGNTFNEMADEEAGKGVEKAKEKKGVATT